MKRVLLISAALVALCILGWILFAVPKTQPAFGNAKIAPQSPPSASNPYIPHESRLNSEPPIERRHNSRVPVESSPKKSYSLRMDAALSGFPENDLHTPGLWDPAPSESCGPPRRVTGNNEECRPPHGSGDCGCGQRPIQS